jgi:membrane protein
VTAGRVPRDRPLWPLDAIIDIARDWITRFFAVQGFDRAMAISAYAYSALIPLLIVYSALVPNEQSFADTLIDRFDLTGSTAASVEQAFAASGTVQSSITGLGALLLLVSALSFTRGMQRLFEGAFGLPSLGMRNTAWGLLWLIVVCLVAGLRPVIANGPITSLILSAALWLLTPYLLLGRRVHWTRLWPVAALSVIGMTAVGIWSVIWLPHTISVSAKQYGVIGIGFALLTYLFAIACVLVAAATGGAMVADRLAREPA